MILLSTPLVIALLHDISLQSVRQVEQVAVPVNITGCFQEAIKADFILVIRLLFTMLILANPRAFRLFGSS
jgi:hypothetical protein